MWRVTPRAKLLTGAGLPEPVLIERAAGIGHRLLVGRVAGTTTLTWGGVAEAGLFVKFFLIIIVIATALPGRASRDIGYNGEVAIVGIV